MAVRHGPYPLTVRKKSSFQDQMAEETPLHLLHGAQDHQLGAEQDQLPCWPTGSAEGLI